uniref:ERBB receptor feedback inhibitor 1 n=1 Tax=Scatophagus argus TaxID=75038 RepID=UPI001ED846A3|nr:ERBB receptor feedback inhibitor 1 [Scatophagus argus]XP_046252143.1 ERBB receptor feedback inhibitor 1 [Scatophagus argus]XP_046252144.1 ERBB receptor feedback inhibitor 1 [Scatophagus argus]XP_046252145.1 ERBB receptor feedback inhibitor 1 [Scatophagus argus]XP_046252147.1 ERBB receptor feedback inhibitor 1 [Scatophagus argus]XP_046252148.1 ERBB receptor feedback inhibitor 1 [Scatophagus argus]XP_046252149.1 ERBB receptor feedback inhibitor 1 [Scatophagus argus]
MARSQNNYWGQRDLNRTCFGLSADMEHNLTEHQQQQMAEEFNCNTSTSQPPFYADTYRLSSDNILRPHEGDQVVPSSQRRTMFGGHQREPKPLPPLPDPEELMSDEAADSEVEFFTSDRQRLLPKNCPKAMCRSMNRDCGQVNYAFHEGSLRPGGAAVGSMAFSWPGREERSTGRQSNFGANIWALPLQGEDHKLVASDTWCGKDQHQSPRLRFSCSGPASQPFHNSSTACPNEKPQIPPRVPIPPKPAALPKTLSGNEEDKPPKIPPRVPLVPPCPPRTPSPKSLPIYINGVMPATQSFAANPKYVSKALQRQQSERVPPAAQFSPCIVPILKDGRQASTTHYILLPPGRPAYSDRRERLLSEPTRTGSSSVWQNR